ncbi:MAG: hypothetical protein AAB444_00095 [Patescibacteria group bacterium]
MKKKTGKIRFVDGFLIRNTLDDDFGIFHAHSSAIASFSPKFYIPKGEIWIDARYKDEKDFLLELDVFMRANEKLPYSKLRALAKKHFRPQGALPKYVQHTKRRGKLTVRMVDGIVIRRYFDPEFILGGHDLVYRYILKNEIWLDAKMDPHEISYILHHEEVERELMAKGKSYDMAHEYATVADKEMRRKHGVGKYPGDASYTRGNLADKNIIRKYFV